MEIIKIRLTDLEQNKGQVAGLPSNPRQWGRGELDILSRLGIEFSVPVNESEGISGLDSQKPSGKTIFGKGYIVSDAVKAEREKAEREKAEREKAEREKAERWELSEREYAIIEKLNKKKGTK